MAQRSGFDGVFNNAADGKPLADLEVTVYEVPLVGDESEATIYSNKTGGSLKPQGFLTTENGLIQFWVEPGYYEIEVSDTEIPARVNTRRIPFNAVAGDTGGIAFTQLDIDNDIENVHIKSNAGIEESKLSLASNAAAGVASRRTIGTGALEACAGNDSRLTNQRTPSDGSVTAAKIVNGQVTAGKLGTDAVVLANMANNSVDTNELVNDAVTADKLDLSDISSVALGSDSAVATTTETTRLSTATMPGGVYIVTVSGSIVITEGNLGVVKLKGVGFVLNESRVLLTSTLSDVRVPFSLSYTGTLGVSDQFDVTIQAPSGGVISLGAGTRINCVRIG